MAWPEVDNPVALAFDASSSGIFWAQQALLNDQIRRTDPSGFLVQTVVSWPDVDVPVALAVSADGAGIYWAQVSPEGDRIKWADATTGLK